MIRRRNRPEVWRKVSIERYGTTYRGEYSVTHDSLTLRSPLGEKVTRLGAWDPPALARVLLAALASGAKEWQ